MIPLVSIMKELYYVKVRIDRVAQSVMQNSDTKIDYLTDTMIELPCAAIRANVMTETAECFYFDINDMTQMTEVYTSTTHHPFRKHIASRASSSRIRSVSTS